MKAKKFKLPFVPVEKDAATSNEKVLVISFFGKSPFNATGCKTGLLDDFPGRTVFQSSILDDPTVDETLLCDIEGYHDVKQRVIFLHLRGVFDVHSLVKIYKQFEEELQKDGFLTLWSDLKSRYARALLLLFSVSHIIVLTQPSHTFDISYLHLFRALDVIRQKTLSELSELLASVEELPKEWVANGRPCCPRMLFFFETCPSIYREDHATKPVGFSPSDGGNSFSGYTGGTSQYRFASHSNELGHRSSVEVIHSSSSLADDFARLGIDSLGGGGAKGKPSIKKLEHSLEDQIYNILKKSRVITNVGANSLFAIPANLEFVFVCTKRDPIRDQLAYMANSLVDLCNNANSSSRQQDPFVLTQPHPNEHTFKNLMQQHLDQAFTKGFDDNTGRLVAPASFEMCPARVWHAVALLAFGLFLREDTTPGGGGAGTRLAPMLRSLLHTDVNFSEARCGKVLPLATATYQENLPTHYTRDFHENKLAMALSVLGMQARGPSYRQSRRRLERECDKFWRASRQMCEVLSLTGNPCTAPLHRGGGEGAGGGVLQGEDEVDQSLLPVSEHSSGVRYVAACNCGRKQGPREDPFSIGAANHDFYQKLAEDCVCKQLEDIRFPVFQPSTKDYKAAQLFKDCMRGDTPRRDTTSRKDTTSSRKESLPKSPECRDMPTPLGNTQTYGLAGFVSGQSVGSDLLQEEATSRLSPSRLSPSRLSPSRLSPSRQRDGSPDGNEGNDILIHVSDLESESSKDKSLIRQPSTTEYLPGMLHDDSPLGLLPEFPSWSLVCLGPSSLYSHNLGLQDQQQAGFLGGSAYLLPWDVTVRLQHHRERCWPAVGDQLYNSRSKTHLGAGHNVVGVRGRKPKTPLKDTSECVIKIFVGVEYECPRGHRFMCSAPDKVLKAAGPGPLKDGGCRVTANDMPLYCPCPCRSAKPLIGQLMRVHIVTPKAPVFVTLNPRVQPAPHQCPVFVTGSDQPLTLSQSAYWVLRLPYVYMGDHGPYVAPKDPVPPGYGRLLAGMYRISELPSQD